MTTPLEPTLELRYVAHHGDAIELAYTLQNPGHRELLVLNRLYRGQGPDGRFDVDANLSYVSFEPGPVAHLTRRIPDMGDDVDEEVPVRAFATRVAPRGRIDETIMVALPIVPLDAYRSFPPRDPTNAELSRGIALSLGWLPASEVDALLLVDLDTNVGRLPLVKVHSATQHIVRADLALAVPVLPPWPTGPWSERVCTGCGATNLGDQPACLRCGTALPPPGAPAPLPPPPVAPAPPPPAPAAAPPPPPPAAPAPTPSAPAPTAWEPTHRVPAEGLDGFPTADRTASARLDPGLPVQVIERSGDWARVVASNGWAAWVDGRRLVPLEG